MTFLVDLRHPFATLLQLPLKLSQVSSHYEILHYSFDGSFCYHRSGRTVQARCMFRSLYRRIQCMHARARRQPAPYKRMQIPSMTRPARPLLCFALALEMCLRLKVVLPFRCSVTIRCALLKRRRCGHSGRSEFVDFGGCGAFGCAEIGTIDRMCVQYFVEVLLHQTSHSSSAKGIFRPKHRLGRITLRPKVGKTRKDNFSPLADS